MNLLLNYLSHHLLGFAEEGEGMRNLRKKIMRGKIKVWKINTFMYQYGALVQFVGKELKNCQDTLATFYIQHDL